MAGNVPKEILEKLEIVKKEMDFSNRMKPPHKSQIWDSIFIFAGGIYTFIKYKSYFVLAIFILFGLMNIARYFEYKKLFRLHSNACDIITYYKNRDAET